MKIGIVTDAHGNLEGLEAALSLLKNCDSVLCSGDFINQYRWSEEVVQRLRSIGAVCVKGNHERSFLSPAHERARRAAEPAESDIRFVAELPDETTVELGNRRIYMTHGSPWAPHDTYLYPFDTRLNRMAEIEADFVVLGHTHFPFVKQFGTTTVVNAGSCGDPRDPALEGALTCAEIDTDTNECQIRVYRTSGTPCAPH